MELGYSQMPIIRSNWDRGRFGLWKIQIIGHSLVLNKNKLSHTE
jgi:hypothetical protein